MRTLYSLINKATIYFTVVSFMTLMCGGVSFAQSSGNGERSLENSAREITPSWLNADLYKTYKVREIKEGDKGMQAGENAEYLEKELGQSLAEDTTTKVKPDLKKKSGSESTSENAASSNASAVISASAAQKMLEDALANGASMTLLDNGNMLNVWEEEGDGPNNIFYEIKDHKGDTVVEKTVFGVEDNAVTSGISSITELDGGRFAVVVTSYAGEWWQARISTTTSLRVYNSNGELEVQHDYKNNPNRYHERITIGHITALDNGDYVGLMRVAATSYGNPSTDSIIHMDSNLDILSQSNYDSTKVYYQPQASGSSYESLGVNEIIALEDGKFAVNFDYVSWNNTTSTFSKGYSLQVMDENMNSLAEKQFVTENADYYTKFSDPFITALADGKIALFMRPYESVYSGDSVSDLESSLELTIYDSDLVELNSLTLKKDSWNCYYDPELTAFVGTTNQITDTLELDDGSTVMLLESGTESIFTIPTVSIGGNPTTVLIIDEGGNVTSDDIALGPTQSVTLAALGNSSFGLIVGSGPDGTSDTWDTSQYLITNGTVTQRAVGLSNSDLSPTLSSTPVINKRSKPALYVQYLLTGNLGTDRTIEGEKVNGSFADEGIVSLLNGLLQAKKEGLLPGEGMKLDPDLIAKLVKGLSIPVGELTPQDMEIAMMLASIFNDPTAEQKLMIDALQALIDEARKLEEETGSEELKQASDDFTQMIAIVLLAQALPDLLKKGDISNINGIFGELDSEKTHILLEYHASVKTYYNNVVKELAANIVTLQLKDILSKSLTERELENLPTQHIDEIINKIRNVKDKTITEEQILKVEAKYREEYLVPAKRILEENIKTLLQGFTQKLFGVLDGAGLVKENTVEGKPVLNIDLSVR